MWFSGLFFSSYFVFHSWGIPMMKNTGLSHLFKWENLHNWWLTKYFLPHCMHLNGFNEEFLLCFELFRFKVVFKAFYRYIYHISEPVSSCRVSVHHWSALVQNQQKVHSLFSYFIKAQCWYCECTQIKVDPLQFQMIYYSYLYEKKITRRILSCFYCKKKSKWPRWSLHVL